MFYPPMAGYAVILIVSLCLAVVSSRGRLARNLAVGVRTRQTLRSDAAWVAAQRASVPYLVALAAISGLHAVALLIVELTDGPSSWGHALAVGGFVLVVVVALLARRGADRAARRASGTES
ncbi:SdpI family protein [Microbacterium sp. SA075R]